VRDRRVLRWTQQTAERHEALICPLVLLDASRWTSDADLHRDIAAALEFPAYYGRNLDALNDCLRDVVDYEYGTTRDATGLVLALTDYDTFVARSPRSAQIVLDIIADQARCAAITGHRILCLVHSRDPKITFEPVGAMDVTWNRAEWFSARRQPGSAPHPLITEDDHQPYACRPSRPQRRLNYVQHRRSPGRGERARRPRGPLAPRYCGVRPPVAARTRHPYSLAVGGALWDSYNGWSPVCTMPRIGVPTGSRAGYNKVQATLRDPDVAFLSVI
jgi:hypothetical protein